MRRNTPAGWAGFIALRQVPVTRPKRHGNWKHGARSHESEAAMRELRVAIRILRCLDRGLKPTVTLPERPRPEGWVGFLRVRAELRCDRQNRRAAQPC